MVVISQKQSKINPDNLDVKIVAGNLKIKIRDVTYQKWLEIKKILRGPNLLMQVLASNSELPFTTSICRYDGHANAEPGTDGFPIPVEGHYILLPGDCPEQGDWVSTKDSEGVEFWEQPEEVENATIGPNCVDELGRYWCRSVEGTEIPAVPDGKRLLLPGEYPEYGDVAFNFASESWDLVGRNEELRDCDFGEFRIEDSGTDLDGDFWCTDIEYVDDVEEGYEPNPPYAHRLLMEGETPQEGDLYLSCGQWELPGRLWDLSEFVIESDGTDRDGTYWCREISHD